MTDFKTVKLADLPLLKIIDAGRKPYETDYVRRHHAGLDAVTTVGSFAIKLDSGYDTARVFYGRDFAGFISAAAESILSVEYQTGDFGKYLIVEADYLHIVDRPPPLLFYDQDSVSVAGVVRWTFAEHFQIGVRAVVGVIPFGYTVLPELGLRYSDWQLRAGAVLLGGDEYTFGSYFSRNAGANVIVKRSF
jgi:hypothetical protein